MNKRAPALKIVVVVAVAALLIAGTRHEQPAEISKTEESPKCTSSNEGAKCQYRICTRITCFSGEQDCTPTEWTCGEWQSGRCRKFLVFYWCSTDN